MYRVELRIREVAENHQQYLKAVSRTGLCPYRIHAMTTEQKLGTLGRRWSSCMPKPRTAALNTHDAVLWTASIITMARHGATKDISLESRQGRRLA